jgi:hypothetical protein
VLVKKSVQKGKVTTNPDLIRFAQSSAVNSVDRRSYWTSKVLGGN